MVLSWNMQVLRSYRGSGRLSVVHPAYIYRVRTRRQISRGVGRCSYQAKWGQRQRNAAGIFRRKGTLVCGVIIAGSKSDLLWGVPTLV